MTQHLISLSIVMDENRIREAAEEQAANKIASEAMKTVSASKWGNQYIEIINSAIRKIVDEVTSKYLDKITDEVAAKLSRSTKFRERVLEKIDKQEK